MKNGFLVKIYNNKLFWLVLSLAVSIAFWTYVTSQETDDYRRTFRGVKIELYGEDILKNSRNLVITDLDISTVTLEITGPRRIVAALDSSDLKARVDVSKLTIASYTSQTYSIVFPDGIDTTNITVNSKTPETVNFMVSSLISKTIQVRGSFDGSVAENRTAEMPSFEPSTITVTGPESYVRNVSYAWVTFGAENIDTTYSVEVGYTLMNDRGEACDLTGLTMSDETVLATLKLLELKDVPLSLNLIYGAGASESNTIVSIEPAYISLAGDSAILSTIDTVVLADIDLNDIENNLSQVYPIIIDDSLRNLSGITEATVSIQLTDLTTKEFTVTNFNCTNITEGFTADILTNELDVTLRGSKESLESITDDMLYAEADLTDYNESVGTFLPRVNIIVEGNNDVGALGNYTITVEIGRSSS